MHLNKKFISLLCALSMLISVFTGLSVTANAADGMNAILKVVSTTDKQVVLDVNYDGADKLQQLSLNIPLAPELIADNAEGKKDVVIDYTAGFAPYCQGSFNKRTNCIVLTGAQPAGMSDEAKKIATVTINFADAISSDLTLEFTKVSFTDNAGKEYDLNPSETQGASASNKVTIEAPLPAVNKGYVMTLVPSECASNKVVFDVTYVGMGDKLQQLSINIPVTPELIADNAEGKKDVVIDYTAGFAPYCQGSFNKRTNCIVLTGAQPSGMSDAESKIARVTINLAADLVDTLKLELSKADATDMEGKEYGLAAEGDLKVDPSAIKVKPEDLVAAPVVTEEPTEAPTGTPVATEEPTEAPTGTPVATRIPRDPRPTQMPGEETEAPIVTEAPAETEAPVVTEAPAETAEPAPVVNKGYVMTLVPSECASNKVVFDVTYVGMGDKLQQLSINIPVTPELIADNAEGKKDVVIDYTAGFAPYCQGSFNKRTNCIVLTGAQPSGMSDAESKIARVTINLAADLVDTLKLELSKADATDMEGKEYGLAAEGDLKVDPSSINVKPADLIAPVVTEAPTDAPVVTDAPVATETPAPTEKPVIGSVAINDKLDAAIATAEEAKDDAIVYVTTKATKKDGTDAVYGVDYVAKLDGKALTEKEFTDRIWAYDGNKASDAIKNIKIDAYTDGITVTFKLNSSLDEYALDYDTYTFTTATVPPTDAAEFDKWTTKSVTLTGKGSSKDVKVTFLNVPEGAKVVFDYDDAEDEDYFDITTTGKQTISKGKITAAISVKSLQNKSYKGGVIATLKDADGNELATSTKLTVNVARKNTTGGSSSGSGNGGNGGGNVIAGGNGNGGIVVLPPNQTVTFQDLDQAPWAVDAITYLAERGIVNGRSATAFEPNADITRAEFAKLVLSIYGLVPPTGTFTTSPYSDVAVGAWYTDVVAVASNLGIVTGYPDGTFRPNNLVSRQEMAVMMYRAANARNTQLSPVNELKTWSDPIGDWAIEAVNALQTAGIMNGTSDITFEAEAGATRAMAAQMIYNLLMHAD